MNEPKDDLLTIRLNHLEEDCAEQPRLRAFWGKELAKAKKYCKELKNQLKLLAAQIGKDVRTRPAFYGLDRGTDKAVEEVVANDLDYQNKQDELIQAEYEEDVIDQFVRALEDRKEQLGNETKLHGQGYWSKPATSDTKDRVQAMKAATEELNKDPKPTRRRL